MDIESFKNDKPFDLTNAVAMANPDFRLDPAYQRNCQRCVVAFELRRRGYDVEAMLNPWPNRSGTTRRRNFNGSQCFRGAKIHNVATGDPGAATRELEKDLCVCPDGTRIAVYWRSRADGKSAHIIACEKVAGKLIFADPQCGQTGKNLLKPANAKHGYYWFRMDDLELDRSFEWNEIVREARK